MDVAIEQFDLNQRIVFSTGTGRRCPECGRAATECQCRRSRPPQPVAPRGNEVVHVGRETQGRRGKGVTVVRGLPLAGDELSGFAARLKKLCGSGGTVEGGVIEIQGDHRDRLVAELGRLGYLVRRAGA